MVDFRRLPKGIPGIGNLASELPDDPQVPHGLGQEAPRTGLPALRQCGFQKVRSHLDTVSGFRLPEHADRQIVENKGLLAGVLLLPGDDQGLL